MISVIVVTWNSDKYLNACLESVRKQTENNVELIIVDNNSGDKTKEIVKLFNPDMFIENTENCGFAKANNQGISVSKGEYVLTLNPDVILESDFLEKVKNKINADKKTGMVSGQLIRPTGVIDSRGIYLTTLRRFYDIGQGEEEGQGSRVKGQGREKELIGPCAAAGFYRKEMLEEIKLGDEYFDEDFFAYVEDVDLAWRAKRAGWKAVYCSDAKAIHYRGGSNTNSKWMQYLSFRNRYLMMVKNDTIIHLLKYLVIFMIYDSLRFCYLIFSNEYILKNFKEFQLLISRAYKKRKLIWEH